MRTCRNNKQNLETDNFLINLKTQITKIISTIEKTKFSFTARTGKLQPVSSLISCCSLVV